MWDEQDNFTRWYQSIFGVIVFFVSVLLSAFALQSFVGQSILFHRDGFAAAGLAVAGLLSFLPLHLYAATGENNINRDDF